MLSCLAAKELWFASYSVEILCFRFVYLAIISVEATDLLKEYMGIIPGIAVDEKSLCQFD